MALRILAKMPVWLFAVISLCAVSVQSDRYRVRFNLENLENGADGYFIVEVHPEWAPLGAERFAEMVDKHFLDGNRFYRVVTGFIAEFGISGDPAVTSAWSGRTIQDDPSHDVGNSRATLSFVSEGHGDRLTQMSINIKDNDYLDNKGYVPFAEVVEGMFNVDRLFNRYGSTSKTPKEPVPSKIKEEGNAYLDREFPLLTRIKNVEVIPMPSTQRTTKAHSGSALLLTLSAFMVTAVVGGGWWFFSAGKQM